MSDRFYNRVYIGNSQFDYCDIHCLYASGADPRVSADEIHNNYEIIFVISGDVILRSEYGQHKLLPNTLIILPPNTYHGLIINEENELFKRIIMGFKSVPELDRLIKLKISKFGLYQSDKITDLYMQLIDICNSDLNKIEKDALFKAIMAQILVNLDKSSKQEFKNYKIISPMIRETVEFINHNLDKPISVAELAKRQNVSYSCFIGTFKAEMNISAYNFILSKKLVMAAEKLSKGQKPTQVAIECGFNDYSGFYKQYKKKFGISPSSPPILNKLVAGDSN